MSAQPRPGRHELGQNFLVDRSVIDRVVELVRSRPGPIVEWGTGTGALTEPLSLLGRTVEGVEIDRRRAVTLDRCFGPHVRVRNGDILRHAPPAGSVVVSNIPFNLTTPILRHLLGSSGWRSAVLIMQWEVARKRAGIGGATQLTAQWWPWFEFHLDRRVAASAFRPRPSVDAGLLVIDRRAGALVRASQREEYQRWVASVFAGRGRGLHEILVRCGIPAEAAARLIADLPRSRRAPLPRDLRPDDWATAFAAMDGRRRSRTNSPHRHRRRG